MKHTSKNSKAYKAAVQAGNKLEMTKKQNLLWSINKRYEQIQSSV